MTTATDDLRLDLPAVLPDAAHSGDACVVRLTTGLLQREGVESVHVVPGDAERPAQVCIHYTPEIIGLRRIRELSAALGAQLTDQYAHLAIEADGIDRPARANNVRELLRRVPGVIEAHTAGTGAIAVEYDRQQTSETALLDLLREHGVAARPSRGWSAPNDLRAADDFAPRGATGVGSVEPVARAAGGRPAGSTSDADRAHDHGEDDHAKDDHGKDDHDHAHGGIFGERTELIFALLCATTLTVGFLLSSLTAVPDVVPKGLYIAAYFFGGFYTTREAIETIRGGRFEIDFLMLIAAAGAAFLGELAEGALLLALFSIGHGLEGYAMGRARRAIEALSELAPETAVVRRDGTDRQVPVEDLVVGDLVLVKPNERLAADGYVVDGVSSIDQSSVTGESVPVEKMPVPDEKAAASRPDGIGADHRVYAGTVNGAGALQIRVSRPARESTLARVVQMVTEAQTQTSPTQQFTDRFQRVFVPAVLVLVVVLLFAWVVIDEPFSASLYRALAVLVAASPCALAISTPSAVLSGLARAARSGVLIKGGGPLENLGTLRAMAFDKTGTLTEGRPELTDVVATDDAGEAGLLMVAAAIESQSDHPLAEAVLTGARDRVPGQAIPTAREVASITGRGVRGLVEGELVHIGKPQLFVEVPGAPVPDDLARAVGDLEGAGRTVMVVRRGDRYLGALGLMDTPRPTAVATVAQLREIGIRRLVMISGDNQRVATAVGQTVGVDEARGDLLPEDKVTTIRDLAAAESKVAMVGDGVNDAPAMANATVGIAMGAAGSAVAMETADVALMADDLRRLPFAVDLSRRASGIIRQNLWASLGVVAVLIPSTIFGLLGIGAAVVVHEGSTLVVVANALRLLALRERSWPEEEQPTDTASTGGTAPVDVPA